MARVQLNELAKAIATIDGITPELFKTLMDEIHLEQPNLYGSILALRDRGYAQQHLDVLIYILLVTFQALKNAKVRLKPISIELQKQQIAAYIDYFDRVEKLPEEKRPAAILHYNEAHLENYLMTFASNTMKRQGFTLLKPEVRKYLVMAGTNIINCVAKRAAYNKLAVEK